MPLYAFRARTVVFLAAALHLATWNAPALTISLTEQGGLTGSVAGGGTLTISPVATDHWTVTVQDPRIGNPTNPLFNLAFIEPETVFGLTAYNNVQMLSVSPGVATFDVLSDEFSPYSTIVPNGGTSPFQNTDVQAISLQFTDVADSIPEPAPVALLASGAALMMLRRRLRPIAG